MAAIILASQSQARRMLLSNAQVPFSAVSSDVDEDIIKQECLALEMSLEETALKLAIAKAQKVSADYPDDYIIGADQILGLEGQGFDKPKSLEEAAERLAFFAGKTHYLHNAACVVRAGETIWTHNVNPEMKMWEISEDQIQTYLAQAGSEVLSSVGAYQLEGSGIRLFEKIEGDYFSILGLPLLALLGFLRAENLIEY